MGASETRNTGIAAGSGKWVLFLDDDIVVQQDLLQVYADSIGQHPDEIGFIGLIKFPQPTTDFTRAIGQPAPWIFFQLPKEKKLLPGEQRQTLWLDEPPLGDIKFSAVYPKSGGGEDVDFFLRVREK